MPALKKILDLSILILLAAGLFPQSAAANVFYSNLGPGGSFNTTEGWLVQGMNVPPSPQVIANSFTPTMSFSFSDARLAMGLTGGTNSVDIFLETDVNGLPGSILEEMVVNGHMGPFPPGNLIIANSLLHPYLTAGTTYWLVAVAGSPDTAAEWNWNSTGDVSSGNFAFNESGSPTGPWALADGEMRGAFEIEGETETVPEPASLVLLGSGLLALRTHARKFKKHS